MQTAEQHTYFRGMNSQMREQTMERRHSVHCKRAYATMVTNQICRVKSYERQRAHSDVSLSIVLSCFRCRWHNEYTEPIRYTFSLHFCCSINRNIVVRQWCLRKHFYPTTESQRIKHLISSNRHSNTMTKVLGWTGRANGERIGGKRFSVCVQMYRFTRASTCSTHRHIENVNRNETRATSNGDSNGRPVAELRWQATATAHNYTYIKRTGLYILPLDFRYACSDAFLPALPAIPTVHQPIGAALWRNH